MNTELERFEHLFVNEDELRKAIVGLLWKMPGVSGVHLTHGTQELGKDIVFYAPGPLEDRRAYACVVKNSRISGSVDSKQGAMTVLHQVRQALDNPYLSVSGQREKIAGVYIMSPYEISQTAIHSIEGSLNAHPGPICFLCGGTLLNLFKKYWPDFLLFEAGVLGAYVGYLHTCIDKDDPIGALIEQHSLFAAATSSFQGTYVPQGFKLALHSVKLKIPLPKFNAVYGPITPSDLTDFELRVTAFQSMVTSPYIQQYLLLTQQELLTFLKDLASFKNAFSVAAQAAMQRFQALTQQQRDLLPEPGTGLPVEKSSLASYVELIETAKTLTEKVEGLVSRANAFATSGAKLTDIGAIFNADLTLFCSLQEMCRFSSNLIGKSLIGRPPVIEYREFPPELLDSTTMPLLITGSAGYGKTSFCRWSVLQDVNELMMGRSDILPVYVPLHQLASKRLESYSTEFFQSSQLKSLVHLSQNDAANRIKTIRLYLDGLDEVSREDRRREIVNLAKDAVSKDPRIQVIITSREHVGGVWLTWMPRLQLNHLDTQQIHQLVTNLLESDHTLVGEFFAELKKTPSLSSLMQVPLLGTLIVAVFRKTRTLPQNRIKLYSIFTELLAGGWDLAKNVKRDTQFGPTPKLFAMQRLAGFMHSERKRECSDSDIQRIKKRLGALTPHQVTRLVQELLEDGLLVRSGLGYAFSHLSFQEYFAAKDLVDPRGKRQTEALRHFLEGDDWWKEVLSFYIGIGSDPEEVHLWINQNVGSEIGPIDRDSRYQFLMEALDTTFPGWSNH
jgi:hypothetical protein